MSIETLADTLDQIGSTIEKQHGETSERLKTLENDVLDLAQKQPVLAPGVYSSGPAVQSKSFGQQVTSSDAFTALAEGRTKSAIVPLNLDLKSLVGTNGDSNDDPVDVQARRSPTIGEDARRNIQLLNDLPRINVGQTSSYEYHQLNAFTNAADVQEVEGDVKASQEMDLPVQTAVISTIAVTLVASTQVLADTPQLRTFLDSKLRFGVGEKLESDIIGGVGGAGRISGLQNQATAFAPATSNTYAADRVSAALTELEVSGWMGSHVLMHPRDWDAIRAERATDGTYVGQGWSTAEAKRLWGIPVVTSNSVTEGSAMVIDSRQLALLDRANVVVELGYQDKQFAQNLVTMRAEGRWGLAVFSPSAVLQFDLATS